jgi:hypothetical protein
MSLETYTRLLIDANPEFPIHFLNIYSTLKKKKGQTSDQCGSSNHAIGGLAYAKTQGLGPAVSQPGLSPLSADEPGQH